MHNWSTDTKKLAKYPEKYKIWKLEQLINYGLDGEKLDKEEVKRAWPKIQERIDKNTKVYLEYLLWGKKPSSTDIKKSFWA